MFQLLHWDSDEGFLTGQPLYGQFIKRWLEKPYNKRRFDGYVRELISMTVSDSKRFSTWLELEAEASGPAVRQAAYLNFFRVRAAEVRQEFLVMSVVGSP